MQMVVMVLLVVVDKVLMVAVEEAVAVATVVVMVEVLEEIILLLHHHPHPEVVVQIHELKIMNLGQITMMDHVFFQFMVVKIQMLTIMVEVVLI